MDTFVRGEWRMSRDNKLVFKFQFNREHVFLENRKRHYISGEVKMSKTWSKSPRALASCKVHRRLLIMGKGWCIYNITCSLTSINCVCALSACRNVVPKLREMFNEESSLDDMVCVKSVKNDTNWKAWTWGDWREIKERMRAQPQNRHTQGGHCTSFFFNFK